MVALPIVRTTEELRQGRLDRLRARMIPRKA
jgi:hypothetical protein